MNTKTLINTAVINSTTKGGKGWADRLFAHWFNRLVYAQIWEDPVVDLKALALRPGAEILCIASGGCNALAYLTADPAAVHVVDLNAHHLGLLQLKRAALAGLPDHAEVLAFLADAAQPSNTQRYREHVAPRLDEGLRHYWEAPDLLGRPRHSMFTRHAYRHGLLGRFIGFSHVLARLLGGNLSAMVDAKTPEEQAERFQRHVAPLFRLPILHWLSRQPAALYSLGIPPAQFDALKADADAEGLSLAGLFEERMRHLACDFPYESNCFAAQAFARRYDPQRDAQLPMYLQASHYPMVKARVDRLHAHHQTLTQFLLGRDSASMDAYLFLDSQDWMDDAQLIALWSEVTRTARPGARVVFRTGGRESQLEHRLPAELIAHWRTDRDRNRALYAEDRSAIYGGVHVYEKIR
ncbi:DUF3419 family protein [Silanimonas sp.]|jgi:S-adenosylmethionine-diacylglycerol 3-amino-3-carboxypropyl transferase|uniref:DUF3419 family protein n=1 Tax=Silanimonas sp. TaxID=1929290 RepID=UPI0022C8C6F3|nr:DUF3419 family protein [Silanimonas sp.]MCZ8115003.1 DUF3419 family protein [Silanimonas sp.]